MTDSTIQIPPQSTGPLVDCAALTNAAASLVYRQTMTLGDPLNINGVQTVRVGSAPAVQSDGAAVVLLRPDGLGSPGTNYSSNAPTYPNVGANFPNSGPYANWFLIGTAPAAAARNCLTIDNMDTNQMLVLRDDGTASSGAQPNNPTAFVLNPKVSAGPEGGHWSTTTFRGRAQVYSSSSSAWVSIGVD